MVPAAIALSRRYARTVAAGRDHGGRRRPDRPCGQACRAARPGHRRQRSQDRSRSGPPLPLCGARHRWSTRSGPPTVKSALAPAYRLQRFRIGRILRAMRWLLALCMPAAASPPIPRRCRRRSRPPRRCGDRLPRLRQPHDRAGRDRRCRARSASWSTPAPSAPSSPTSSPASSSCRPAATCGSPR